MSKTADAIFRSFRKIAGREDPSLVASEAGPSTAAGAPDLATIAAKSSARRNKPSKLDEQIRDARSQAAADQLFVGENWEQVAGMYFDARLAMTGFEGFGLSDPQRKLLGSTLSSSMRLLVNIDPAYLALLVFTTNFGAIIAQKEVAYRAYTAKQEQSKRPAQVPPLRTVGTLNPDLDGVRRQ